MSWQCAVAYCSLQGRRSENEDLALVERAGRWTASVVLDGMGGQGIGSEASRTVGASLVQALQKWLPTLSEPERVCDCLRTAITEACQALLRRQGRSAR